MKPFNVPDLLEMIKKLTEEKTNAYLKMFAELNRQKRLRQFLDISTQINGSLLQ